MMKIIIWIAVAALVSGCAFVNTIDSVKQKGSKSEVYTSSSSQSLVSSQVGEFLSQCYKTSLVKMGGTTLGEVIHVDQYKIDGGTEYAVKKMLNNGYSHLLIVSVVAAAEDEKTEIVGYANDFTRAASFEQLDVIAKGGKPKCPYTI
ncbi:hypothetical protein [Shewanella woodyi]|uniref:Lipoprotein n=1 Tax=Shewanella woodyi (strain ATCC 51908 / MS32) TaxID=392500 RepID=B1KFV4_SHEWM|nr:hypothetical protein [Shewanella woodyi]ACA85270.1 hypothetical protein Swoo_0977 [Shewanella woodyi ATCC 51908]